ncbi:hypothetical protein BKA69DRAFT_1148569 [Paraphysoderma sedebokerense]|nr:hypothetical protein BKA69DRAFT_1148569 [Paraphysoderma sedebokerense]
MINKKSGMKTEDDMLQLLCLSRAEKIAFKLQKKLISVGQPPLISQDRQETVALLTNKVGVIKGIGFPALLKFFIYLGIAEFFLVLIVIGYSGGYSNKALTPSFNAGGLEWIPLYFGIVVFLLAVPAFAYLLRNLNNEHGYGLTKSTQVKDSLYLRLEQTVAFTLFYPFFILYLLTYFVRPVAATFTFGYTFWLVILLTILHTVTVTTPALYVLFKKDSSDQKALLNNSLESFSRVLNDSFLFAELKKILVENFAIENALFLEEFDVLVPSGMSRQTHTILDADGTQLQIQSIIRNFIVSGAPNELNITSKTRKAIVAAWQRGGQLSADILEPAKEEVVQMMYQNSYPRLLRRIASAKKKQATV